MSSPARNLVYAQVTFFALLGVCVATTTRGITSNHGWSYYEGDGATVVPYALGFVAVCVFIWRAAALLADGWDDQNLAAALRVVVGLLLLDLLTPDSVNGFFYVAHVLASAALFLFELGLGAWLAFRPDPGGARRSSLVALLGLQFGGGLLAMFSQMQLVPALSEGMFIFQAASGALVTVAVSGLRPLPETRLPQPARPLRPHEEVA